MADYDFTTCLSPLDFELLSKDLLEAELGIQLEIFSAGRDKGIDLRYAPVRRAGNPVFSATSLKAQQIRYGLSARCCPEIRQDVFQQAEEHEPPGEGV